LARPLDVCSKNPRFEPCLPHWPTGATATNLLTRDEARRIAAGTARLPELLRAERPNANALFQRR
jgi:hypothetical protein